MSFHINFVLCVFCSVTCSYFDFFSRRRSLSAKLRFIYISLFCLFSFCCAACFCSSGLVCCCLLLASFLFFSCLLGISLIPSVLFWRFCSANCNLLLPRLACVLRVFRSAFEVCSLCFLLMLAGLLFVYALSLFGACMAYNVIIINTHNIAGLFGAFSSVS